jgi:hypothetical protein
MYVRATRTAAHASFSHDEFAIAVYLEYLDDEAPGEDEEDPEDADMKDTNFVDDWRQSDARRE